MDKQQQLLEIKRKILDTLVPLVVNQDGEPTERAETVLSLIDLGNSSPDLYNSALEIVNKVEDTALRTDYLMRLLGSVQADLSDEVTEEAEQPQQTVENVHVENQPENEQQG